MTIPATPSAPRGSGLSDEELAALKPHVINLRRGQLADRPAGEGEYFSTAADVEAIFATHLPAFLAGRSGPVPLMVNAHGGLVTEAAGLRAAASRIPWWKENGVYPIYFVWETGLVTSLADALAGWLGGSRGPGDFKDRIVELAARFGQGERVWGEMKEYAEAASAGGGASVFADALGSFMNEHRGALTVHAVGHSAGSIFHSYFIPAAVKAGVDRFETVSFLAPAVRTDLFKEKLKDEVDQSIGRLSMFTMTDDRERADNCVRVYGKSLLYLVRAAFEPRIGDPILGLQDSVRSDPDLRDWFGEPDSPSSAQVVWSVEDRGPFSSSDATSHGAFDDDPATMESVLRRIVDRKDVTPFPLPRAVEPLWPTQPRDVPAPTWPHSATRKALCVGINAYPDAADQLSGCVADAGAWATELEKAGFAVHLLADAQATRSEVLLRMLELVSTSAPGDTLVVQYAGHGTTAPDLDGDEAASGQGGNMEDEALCPVDFRTGELIIDDDLGLIWDQLPDGVALTLFFDSCHSGDGQRRILSQAELEQETTLRRLPRRVVLSEADREAFRARRGYTSATGSRDAGPGRAADGRAADAASPGAPVDGQQKPHRELLFSACQPTELAYETAGHGDFTSKASPLLADAIGKLTNEQFLGRVVDGFGDRQHPKINGEKALFGRTFLAAEEGSAPTAPIGVASASSGAAASGGVPASGEAVQAAAAHNGGGAGTLTAVGKRADDAEVAALEATLAAAAGAAEHRATRVARLLRAIADVIEE
ncbi:caspase family protein [Sinomonas sp. R1AF57]|uniref:caspase family protein n=1 Tax=Sinomonas sp. R1AF57 TaxID=2020377 RepID=UPI001ABF3CA9|nr:caspase family protein [Sinomonas sp. R1AF57]